MMPQCNGAMMPSCKIAKLPDYNTSMLPGYHNFWLSCLHDATIPGPFCEHPSKSLKWFLILIVITFDRFGQIVLFSVSAEDESVSDGFLGLSSSCVLSFMGSGCGSAVERPLRHQEVLSLNPARCKILFFLLWPESKMSFLHFFTGCRKWVELELLRN